MTAYQVQEIRKLCAYTTTRSWNTPLVSGLVSGSSETLCSIPSGVGNKYRYGFVPGKKKILE